MFYGFVVVPEEEPERCLIFVEERAGDFTSFTPVECGFDILLSDPVSFELEIDFFATFFQFDPGGFDVGVHREGFSFGDGVKGPGVEEHG